MSAARWIPIVGLLAMFALVPGALAHGCVPEGDPTQTDFSTQSTVGPSFSPILVVALASVPIVGALLAVAAALSAKSKVATGNWAGSWVFTPAQWVWVPYRK
jgi:hypothetical protein